MNYYTGTQEQIIEANNQISSNCGLPFMDTQTWAIPQSSYSNSTLFFILMPNIDGWTREDGTYFTQAQMIENVVNVTEQESQQNWFPPVPPP